MKDENKSSNSTVVASFEANLLTVTLKAAAISFAGFLLEMTNSGSYIFLMAVAYSTFIIFRELTKN